MDAPVTARPWVMLTLGTLALTVACSLLYGMPFLVPTFRAQGVSLSGAGALAAAPSLGLVATLILWGGFADRYGERLAMWLGLGLTGLAGLVAAASHTLPARAAALALVGAAGASVNSASGRLIMGWFPQERRGVAMGVRQMGQPLGVAVAALVLPPLAHRYGVSVALIAPSVLCLLVTLALLLFAVDPPRHAPVQTGVRPASPYRDSAALWRVHAASALLVVPQFATATFAAEYLVAQRHWDPAGAGRILAAVAVLGATGRLVAGRWSDRVGNRLGPMRQIAVVSMCCMLAVAATAWAGSVLVILALAAASIVSVTDNGLGFTATAEFAGPFWAGRALGTQNTAQNLAAFGTGPLVGALAAAHGYGLAFAICAVFPLVGAAITPVTAERRRLGLLRARTG
ncbi:MFS transporter [Allobranchiibius sp. GilTou73]|uniref:MFS transporter n=1 Tax=Allobranchiibius sp. GilTou73 TaxID=2904523 RepID=UPI001F1E6501|nr:MFS transporter [Allobranchiibius sp. GilTou73]UIJ33887.1 MFS transporter [Allobranchiibius sp. GilTou73]